MRDVSRPAVVHRARLEHAQGRGNRHRRFQSSRSPDESYRTAPLKGLWAHGKGGFYHDGRFARLIDVVNHYDTFQRLGLSEQEKRDLVQYLQSL